MIWNLKKKKSAVRNNTWERERIGWGGDSAIAYWLGSEWKVIAPVGRESYQQGDKKRLRVLRLLIYQQHRQRGKGLFDSL